MISRRTQIAIAAAIALAVVGTFAACGGCGKRAQAPATMTMADGAVVPIPSTASAEVDAALVVDDPILWQAATDGDREDLSVLAVHAGAAGLIEGAADPARKKTALRAMAFAAGWAQLPFLVRTASGKSDDEAKIALDAIVELAARPRRPEDVEDVEELKEGCDALVGIAKDPARGRTRRVPALRALRMMPCPKAELPTDLDAH